MSRYPGSGGISDRERETLFCVKLYVMYNMHVELYYHVFCIENVLRIIELFSRCSNSLLFQLASFGPYCLCYLY